MRHRCRVETHFEQWIPMTVYFSIRIYERVAAYILSIFLLHINYFKLSLNDHVNITHFKDFSKTFGTFQGLEITIF